MKPAVVIWEKTEGVGLITLNRPERLNAMNRELLAGLNETLEEAAADDEVKVILLTGSGKGFCAGGDVKGHPSFETDDPMIREKYIKEAQRIVLQIHRMLKPVIAAVNGVAAGAGLDLALACDIRICSVNAVFTESFAKAGLMNDMGGSYFLPRIIGLGRAMEMIYTGDIIDAQEAYRIGLVNKVHPKADMMSHAMDFAKKLAKGPGQSYRLSKWAVNRAQHTDLEAALEHEMFGQNLLLGTEDVSTAVEAFARKKEPIFKGR